MHLNLETVLLDIIKCNINLLKCNVVASHEILYNNHICIFG